MSGAWTEVTIGEIVDFFDSKRVPLSSVERQARQGPYPYYGASGVIDSIDDYIFEGRYLLVAEDGENLNSRKLPVAFFADGKFWVNNHAHVVRGKKGLADDAYLHAWFANADISPYITGAAQPKLSQGSMKRIVVRLPPLPAQQRIGAILSAYEEMIDNNKRRIQVLEHVAQAIYREWFVEFRFPGHQGVSLVESDLGLVPEGWSVSPIGEVVETFGGGTPARQVLSYWEEGTINWFTPSDLTATNAMFIRESSSKITAAGLGKSSARMLPPGSVMMTSRATVGVVAIAEQESCTNQGFITCVPNDRLGDLHLYFWLRDNVEVFLSLASGATFKEINKSTFRSVQMVVPVFEVEQMFARLVDPIGALIRNLLDANRYLHQTRSLLLPRLISGEVDVSEADVDTAGLVA